ncbi:MAG: dihydroneopterin aldolase [Clostridia bacterium]|nr:dihydroneopterin aldolase [Clostridia bacterium]
MDKIIINNLHIFAYHGVNPEEKENGQNFYLDIVCTADLGAPGQTDNLNDTVNYAKIVKAVTKVFTENKYDLIERAAQVVADCVLEQFEKVQTVKVTLRKPEAPVKADFGFVAVEIERSRA